MKTRQAAVQRAWMGAFCATAGLAAHVAGLQILVIFCAVLATFFTTTSALCWWIAWQVGEEDKPSEGHEDGTDPTA